MKSAFLPITAAKIASQYCQLHLYRKHLFINKQLKCLIVIFYILLIITFAGSRCSLHERVTESAQKT